MSIVKEPEYVVLTKEGKKMVPKYAANRQTRHLCRIERTYQLHEPAWPEYAHRLVCRDGVMHARANDVQSVLPKSSPWSCNIS